MLEGKNILLRPLKMMDWEKTIQWRNNFSIKQMAMMHPFPVTEMIEKEWYENLIKSTDNRSVYFTIAKKDDSPIGFISLNKINYIHKNCELGIVIGETIEQGKGYGKEAIDLIISYAFNSLNLFKIYLFVVELNHKAIDLYFKLGFIEEGRLISHYYMDGKYIDIHILSLFNRH